MEILSISDDHFDIRIDAFNFIKTKQSVKITCNFYVCDKTSQTSKCTQKCEPSMNHGSPQFSATTTVAITHNQTSLCASKYCPANSDCLEEFYPVECRCKTGFVFNEDKGVCDAGPTFTAKQIKVYLGGFQCDYNDSVSTDFLKFAQVVEPQLSSNLLAKSSKLMGLKIKKVTRGSVLLDCDVLYEGDEKEAKESFMVVATGVSTSSSGNNSTGSGGGGVQPTIGPVKETDNSIIIIIVVFVVGGVLFSVCMIVFLLKNKRERKRVGVKEP